VGKVQVASSLIPEAPISSWGSWLDGDATVKLPVRVMEAGEEATSSKDKVTALREAEQDPTGPQPTAVVKVTTT